MVLELQAAGVTGGATLTRLHCVTRTLRLRG
jgi:hypothetical protein